MSDTDLELLARYTRHHSEEAFAKLVRRHLDLVHSAAMRQVRSPELAEEVAQATFIKLARQARQLAPNTVLSAWLYQVARRESIDVVRREARRQLREQTATAMNAMNANTTDWTHIEPLLDEAMHALDATDRTAVLLRYFEKKSLREVGVTLGTNEDAARKRLSRAVERLREFFSKRGITIGASGLVVVISANAVQPAPIALAVTVSAAAAQVGTTVLATVIAAMTQAITLSALRSAVVAGVLVAGVATPVALQHRAQVKLREENQALRQRVDDLGQLLAQNERRSAVGSIPAFVPLPPAVPAAVPSEPRAEAPRRTNLIARLLQLRDGERPPRLSGAQVEGYLKENRRNAASLLTAYRVSEDPAMLLEAMQKYPGDPQVSFAAIFKKDASPEERRRALESFKQSDPRNALANYLSCLDYFKAGQTDQAVQELNAAAGKSTFQDYSRDFVQNDEEAWRAAGYSVAEAKTAAAYLMSLPHLSELKQVGQATLTLAGSYRQAGDETSAQAALQAGLNLGQRLDNSPGLPLVSHLRGLTIEKQSLGAMDPNSAYGSLGQTVKDRLDELNQQRQELKELMQQFEGVQRKLSERDWISYKDRWNAFGEEAALRWVVGKYSVPR